MDIYGRVISITAPNPTRLLPDDLNNNTPIVFPAELLGGCGGKIYILFYPPAVRPLPQATSRTALTFTFWDPQDPLQS